MSPMPAGAMFSHSSSGGRLVAGDGRQLPLRETTLVAHAAGGLARVELRQTFVNEHDEALRVHYMLPLPETGTVVGYTVTLGERTIHGKIERREDARRQFDAAMLAGRTASVLEEERASLFTQELGNIPPRAQVIVRVEVDQRLDWIPGGEWEWRFPTVVAPRYLGAEGRVDDAEAVTVDVGQGWSSPTASFELSIEDEIEAGCAPSSPSHALASTRNDGAVKTVRQQVALDRDIVVRWPAARLEPGATLRVARSDAAGPRADQAFALLTITPPIAPGVAIARDLILLLDSSGSMAGAPFDHARRIAIGLVESLGPGDTIEMIAFSNEPRRWWPGVAPAEPGARREAIEWLRSLKPGGGTEMTGAVTAAIAPIRADAQRQVVLLTDGEVAFESEACAAVREHLPERSRVHVVGIGSAVNRTLTHGIARAGRGTEIVVGLEEEPAAAVARVVRALERPVLVDLVIEGSAVLGRATDRLPDVMAGAPVVVALDVARSGGVIDVRGTTPDGAWVHRLDVAPVEAGSGDRAVVRHFARELVGSLEAALWSTERDQPGILAEIERVGLEFGISTRRTSWIAVFEEPSVEPGAPTRMERIPQQPPHGVSPGMFKLAEALQDRVMSLPPDDELFGLLRGSFRSKLGHRDTAGSVLWSGPKPRVQKVSNRPARHGKGNEPARIYLGRWLTDPIERCRILEFTVAGDPLEWDAATLARVQLDDGSWVEAAILPGGTTPPRQLQAGDTARVLLISDVLATRQVKMVEIRCPNEPVRIRF